MENIGSQDKREIIPSTPEPADQAIKPLTQEFVTAMVKAQSNINHAYEDSKGNYGGYASVESIITTVKKAYNDEGIFFFQRNHPSSKGVIVTTHLFGHGSELNDGGVAVPAENLTPQKYGAALTYARKYSLSLACGIGSDDDDGQEIQDDAVSKAKSNGKVWYADLPLNKFLIDAKDLDKITQVKCQKEIADWLNMPNLKKAEEFAKTITVQNEKLKPVYSTIRTSMSNYFTEAKE
jgi:hypothetical protein